jgi:integrase/recombinase XerD
MRLLYGAGLRVSKVVDLTWDKIHARDGGLAQLTIHGKGQKIRHVLISAATWEELKQLRGNAPAEAPLFTSRRGGRVNHRGEALNRPAGARHRAQGRSSCWHPEGRLAPLAATCPCLACPGSRCTPHLVMRTLGHGSLAITGRYTHVRPTASSSEYLPVSQPTSAHRRYSVPAPYREREIMIDQVVRQSV